MGIPGAPLYGEDFASTIEANKKIINKIESGKASKKDIEELVVINAKIYDYLKESKD